MAMNLTGIQNQNEYYTNHYFASIFEENAESTISAWRAAAKEENAPATPWARLRSASRNFYTVHDRYSHSRFTVQTLQNICSLAGEYLNALGYPESKPLNIELNPEMQIPVYRNTASRTELRYFGYFSQRKTPKLGFWKSGYMMLSLLRKWSRYFLFLPKCSAHLIMRSLQRKYCFLSMNRRVFSCSSG